ncbi:hypothetical protein WME87_44600 [Sorangium sp. So ce1389]
MLLSTNSAFADWGQVFPHAAFVVPLVDRLVHGPIGGFDAAKVEAAFFGDLPWKVLFLVNLGYGDPAKLYPRNPRLTFSEVARIE